VEEKGASAEHRRLAIVCGFHEPTHPRPVLLKTCSGREDISWPEFKDARRRLFGADVSGLARPEWGPEEAETSFEAFVFKPSLPSSSGASSSSGSLVESRKSASRTGPRIREAPLCAAPHTALSSSSSSSGSLRQPQIGEQMGSPGEASCPGQTRSVAWAPRGRSRPLLRVPKPGQPRPRWTRCKRSFPDARVLTTSRTSRTTRQMRPRLLASQQGPVFFELGSGLMIWKKECLQRRAAAF